MTQKIRIKVEGYVELEPDPKNYPGCTTIEEMLEVDLENISDDPFSYIEMMEEDKLTVTGEIVEVDE